MAQTNLTLLTRATAHQRLAITAAILMAASTASGGVIAGACTQAVVTSASSSSAGDRTACSPSELTSLHVKRVTSAGRAVDGKDVKVTATDGTTPATVVYLPPTGTAPILSSTGSGSIATTGANFAPSTTVTISGCAVTPSSPAFPANAFSTVSLDFAAPNGQISIACAPQTSAASGTLSCNESFSSLVPPTMRTWPITCPARGGAGQAPTAALAASSVGLVNGIGSMGINVLTSGTAVGSLGLNCSIPPGTANFQITSGGQRLIGAPAIPGANAPAIGLGCVEQSTQQSSILSCAQTASPAPNPAPLTAMVTCPAVAAPPPTPVGPTLPVPTISRSGAFLLAWAMLALVANYGRKARAVRKKF